MLRHFHMLLEWCDWPLSNVFKALFLPKEHGWRLTWWWCRWHRWYLPVGSPSRDGAIGCPLLGHQNFMFRLLFFSKSLTGTLYVKEVVFCCKRFQTTCVKHIENVSPRHIGCITFFVRLRCTELKNPMVRQIALGRNMFPDWTKMYNPKNPWDVMGCQKHLFLRPQGCH